MPLERSILWRPTSGASPKAREDYPIFVEPKVLTALAEHALSAAKHGVLGFLLGELCQDPQRSVPFLFVDSTVRLNQAIYGDKTNVVVSKLWDRVHAELDNVGGHLLGWYHTHPPQGIALAPGDIETHLLFFTRPWNCALVLGMDATGPAAAFYRPAHDALSVTTCLPFYEIGRAASDDAKGAKASALPWTNYATQEAVVYQSQQTADAARKSVATAAVHRATLEVLGRHAPVEEAAPPPSPPPPPPAPPPSAPPQAPRPAPLANLPLIHEEPRHADPSPPRPRVPPGRVIRVSAQRAQARRGRRWPAVLLVGVVVVALGAGAWLAGFLPFPLPGTWRELVSTPGAGDDAATRRLDSLAETVSGAVTAYAERAALFDRRRVSCAELQRGLLTVEEGWMAYSARGATGAPPLDSARARRDQFLYTSVDSVERHFEGTACRRP